eukprot:CAMPEP_0206014104 /NCGR_PEP_ID=MMETSP1464-20131121/17713_1 /ASSEMBLY_ACC=CAM_ASM_001124 /TAXON_ID=119497 /ORGANISM="Exanthemachrysis gayraliae, Strain RCC1523" /LENGTH=157 /DNA_ID=CAMNT_0053387851 /DNA_START=1 /DNA_END=474 /DNA_ORIENTATION=+
MWPGVLEAILRRVPKARPAVLRDGFRRMAVAGQPFPAVVHATPGDSQAIHGLLLSISSNEAQIFDYFEGDLYKKELGTLTLVEGVQDSYRWATSSAAPVSTLSEHGEEASFYVWTGRASLRDVAWDSQAHFVPFLAAYVENAKAFGNERVIRRLHKS